MFIEKKKYTKYIYTVFQTIQGSLSLKLRRIRRSLFYEPCIFKPFGEYVQCSSLYIYKFEYTVCLMPTLQ